jgi:hypothetical protein
VATSYEVHQKAPEGILKNCRRKRGHRLRMRPTLMISISYLPSPMHMIAWLNSSIRQRALQADTILQPHGPIPCKLVAFIGTIALQHALDWRRTRCRFCVLVRCARWGALLAQTIGRSPC